MSASCVSPWWSAPCGRGSQLYFSGLVVAALACGAAALACGGSAPAEASGGNAKSASVVVKTPPAGAASAPTTETAKPEPPAAPEATPAVTAPPPAASAPAAEAAADNSPSAAPRQPGDAVPGAASLYARLGDVLVPLGCKGPHGWHNGRICLPDDEDASVSVLLQPTLKGETGMRSATSASIPFVLSGTEEPGLVMVEKERETASANRPLLGFGLVGSTAQVRYTRAGAARVEQEASAWCKASKGACRGIAAGTLPRLVGRAARPREQNDLVAQVRQAVAPLDEALPIRVIALFPVTVGSRQQRMADVEVETGKSTSPKAAELQLPESVHFLFTETPHGFRLASVPREDGFGLGEAGELVAAIDLDADGTDELILSWSYSEGRSWELVRRSGDKLIVVGGFTDGA